MREIWTVFRFTLRDAIRKKAFILTTVFVLVVLVAGCVLVGLIGGEGDAAEPGEAPPDKTGVCYYIDAAGLIPGGMEAAAAADGSTEFVAGEAGKLDAYKAEVEKDKTKSILLVSEADGRPSLTFYSTDFLSGLPADALAGALQSAYVAHILGGAGVSPALVQDALAGISYTSEIVGKMDLSGYGIGMLLMMIIFFAVYYYGYGVAMSVASEKTSRVMETLIVSAKPSRLLLGKCLAMGALGLVQLLAFLVVGALSFQLFIPADFTLMGMPLALSSFTAGSAALVLVYFLLGYALYAMMNSVCGATVSRAEDLNSAMMPVMLVSVVAFYAALMTVFAPTEGIKRIVTYIPFTSPFVLPFRLLNERVPAGDIAVSIALLVIAIVLVAAVSVKLYSASVLHYGQRLKLKDIFKLKA